ncbi:MAG: TIGR04141 family sporadically distributed protein [Holosporaceae bacterium]|jgi:uncharacterized protein (TIGR04141 family)|nr:TIGR04141 family sporadically distributed protein [Holosporaceae bacterium]
MKNSQKSNKLSIYLIKDEVQSEEQIIEGKSEKYENDKFALHFKQKPIRPAVWVNFFNNDKELQEKFKSASNQAVLLRKIEFDGKIHTFAITFGTGHCMLNDVAIVPYFGLRVVLNTADHIKKMDSRNDSSYKSEQIYGNSDFLAFSFDSEIDFLTKVTGSINKESDYKVLGTTITGGHMLSATVKFNVDTIDDLLVKLYEFYILEKYKDKGFEFIDKMEKCAKGEEEKLYNKLNDELKESPKNNKILLEFPEIIPFENIKGFKYSNNKKKIYDELRLSDIGSDLSVDKLKNIKINVIDTEGNSEHSWRASDCLCAQIELDENIYIFSHNNWYKLNTDFVSKTNDTVKGILSKDCPNINWPEYKKVYEDEYNKSLTEANENAIYMHGKCIEYGGKNNKIEFCDVYDRNTGSLIHVKIYACSKPLSHLFQQGAVSASLLKDSEYLKKVEDKIQKKLEFSFEGKTNFNVIFCILIKHNTFEIPFFSKIMLINIVKQINNTKNCKKCYIKIIYSID